ncbi:peptidoglycan recognition protein family protein [Streptomyces sp. NBC_01212]|uniref:peptidoglycan recognition protein family protein n=1 Tax=Streptomyces sp. NBC_01212 TaxID=2903775 RepID=UPI002E0F1D20|nr:N-acetylmuramoyl-L-alanine amidase [Streptomyces sp. NBC_01212]
MATPMAASQFIKALEDEGVDVREYRSWRTHNRNHKGPWSDLNGVVIHHTAGSNSLALCYDGMVGLPGPLCHTHLAKSGLATMVGYGRANHAGSFPANAFNAMKSESSTHPRPSGPETVDGNAHTYGIEIENLGNGKDFYPTKQYDAAVRWASAICRFHGWTADSVIGHKEGTTRKIDPKGPVGAADGPQFDMDQFRKDVAARLKTKDEAPAPTKPATPSKPATSAKPTVDLSNLIAAARRDPGLKQGGTTHAADVKVVEAALKAEGLLAAAYASDGSFGSSTVAAYRKWQQKCGYTGSAADGIPGKASLEKLGAKRGFKVRA